MISTDTTDSSNEPFLLQEPSYQTSDPELIPNPWIRTGKTALFFCCLKSGRPQISPGGVQTEKIENDQTLSEYRSR